jgi:hypothetical protein
MPSKKVKNKAKKILPIKAKSVLDIIRGACSFDTYSKDLLAFRKGNKNFLYLLGEELDDTIIAYYVNTDEIGEFAIYSATTEGEQLNFSNEYKEQFNAHYINIILLESFPFEERKGEEPIIIKVERYESLIKSLVKKAVEKEEIEKAYIFENKSKYYIGVFDLLEELTDNKKTFYYAELKEYSESSFIRYNYSSDKIEFTKDFGEHSYLYVKLINLAEPFPFFKDKV